jgi:hypothetical protein
MSLCDEDVRLEIDLRGASSHSARRTRHTMQYKTNLVRIGLQSGLWATWSSP